MSIFNANFKMRANICTYLKKLSSAQNINILSGSPTSAFYSCPLVDHLVAASSSLTYL